MVKLIAAVTVAAAAVGLARRVLLFVPVQGASMEPTLRSGQRVLAVRRPLTGPLQVGDVVVVRHRGGPGALGHVVKRVTALAGERIPGSPGAVLDAGQVWIEGDGKGSYDSRHFGPVAQSEIVAVVNARLWGP